MDKFLKFLIEKYNKIVTDFFRYHAVNTDNVLYQCVGSIIDDYLRINEITYETYYQIIEQIITSNEAVIKLLVAVDENSLLCDELKERNRNLVEMQTDYSFIRYTRDVPDCLLDKFDN